MRIEYPPELPITTRKDEIVRVLREHSVLVLAGETGSGKTTQIPKMCLEALATAPRRNPNRPLLIGCTQPRRVAALSIARRLAQELGVQYGQEVGSKIRFNDVTSRATQVKVMTDGILLAEMQGDPELRQYDCIIIDEAHERSLNIDFLLGHLKLLVLGDSTQGVSARRPDLKVVITSATIETEAFSRAFGNAPIIEVSGRMYPVETLYRPFDHLAEELGEITYIDAAAHAVEEIVGAHAPGDMLIFMPTEKDIRETRDQLQAHYGSTHEIVPLFGRLSSGEQEKVFAPGPQPRIVIATNIAETSLTIPRIRYVIDAGLARISRYSPRSRTKRLPIEPISQSSANQRKGRCGRLAEGLCIRLYSEEEFAARPVYTQPEIQRSNLAEVILRMKAFHLGDVETFPFLNPPQPQAIRAGYQLLIELGALDEKQSLTPLGWDLARLPVDPAIGRMIVQAVKERALSEVLVIAAGLSVQDPRERPTDAKEAAEQAHRRFTVADSDFLTLLSIWNAYHDEFERLKTQGQMRRFCREHFLSYMRMREWVDVHAQLEEALESVDFTSIGETITTIKAPPPTDPNRKMDVALYAAIHRSILAGLLMHVAQRQEKNIYCATGNREVMVFPGSNLFDKNVSKQARQEPRATQARPITQEKTFQPKLIVAGEIVETSRLFARTAARVDPTWIVELGAHVCKFAYQSPHWNAEQGRVLVTEKVLIGGLELLQRLVPYAKVNSREATEIFIRSALVEEPIAAPHPFLKKNQVVRERIETWQTRLRSATLPNVDEALYRFYAKRIQDVSSVHDLNRFVKEEGKGDSNFLLLTEADLIGDRDVRLNESSFPESLDVEGHSVPLQYAYAPGEEQDGVTAQVPVTLVQHLRAGMLEWAVPGWREEQIRTLLKALPKSLRVPLMPLEPKVEEIVRELRPENGSLLEALSAFVNSQYKVVVTPQSWPPDALPTHLKARVQVIGPGNKVLATTRDLNSVRSQLRETEKKIETNAWDLAAQKFERYHLESWDFGDLPERIEVRSSSGIPLFAYPGLQVENGDVSSRLFRAREDAIRSSRAGVVRLAELTLARDFGWVQKDLHALNAVKDLYITLGPPEELIETAYVAVRNQLLNADMSYPLKRSDFEALVTAARTELPGVVPQFVNLVSSILRQRQEILLSKKKYPEMDRDLGGLVPSRFLEKVSAAYLQHLPRYLKAMIIRAERWAVNPLKDQEKSRQIQPFVQRWNALSSRKDLSADQAKAAQKLRWLIEELKVSLYAQELGTSEPISIKRLEKFIEENRI